MIGHVDPGGRALVIVSIRPSTGGQFNDIEVWVDTGFNGDLVLPRRPIENLALPASGTVKAVLADGSQVALQTHSCVIDWFDQQRNLEVVSNDGEYPLLGVGLFPPEEQNALYVVLIAVGAILALMSAVGGHSWNWHMVGIAGFFLFPILISLPAALLHERTERRYKAYQKLEAEYQGRRSAVMERHARRA